MNMVIKCLKEIFMFSENSKKFEFLEEISVLRYSFTHILNIQQLINIGKKINNT